MRGFSKSERFLGISMALEGDEPRVGCADFRRRLSLFRHDQIPVMLDSIGLSGDIRKIFFYRTED